MNIDISNTREVNEIIHENNTLKITLAGEIRKNEILTLENNELKNRINSFHINPQIAKEVKRTNFIDDIFNGKIIKHSDSSPFQINNSTTAVLIYAKLIEVKYPTKRWTWARPLGNSGDKIFDRLILIGEKDPRYMNRYKDSRSQYIIFDIPFNDVKHLTVGNKHIELTTNPDTVKNITKLQLYNEYQVTVDDLRKY